MADFNIGKIIRSLGEKTPQLTSGSKILHHGSSVSERASKLTGSRSDQFTAFNSSRNTVGKVLAAKPKQPGNKTKRTGSRDALRTLSKGLNQAAARFASDDNFGLSL